MQWEDLVFNSVEPKESPHCRGLVHHSLDETLQDCEPFEGWVPQIFLNVGRPCFIQNGGLHRVYFDIATPISVYYDILLIAATFSVATFFTCCLVCAYCFPHADDDDVMGGRVSNYLNKPLGLWDMRTEGFNLKDLV